MPIERNLAPSCKKPRAIFESWVAAEMLKQQVHAGHQPRLYHYRESRGLEVDLLVEEAGRRLLEVA